jgi:hypothetical protein
MAIHSTQCSLKQIHKHLNGESRETPTVQLQSTMLIHIYPLIPNHSEDVDPQLKPTTLTTATWM